MSQTKARFGGEAGALVDQLRRAITHGELLPNQRLVEVELSERYNVGRAAVRSALLELTKERLVEHVQNRGARVRVVSTEEAIQVLEVRQVVEVLCAAKAAENATAGEIANLRKIISGMETAVANADLYGYSELNEAFHTGIRDAGHHVVAAEIAEGLRNQTRRQGLRIAFVPGRTNTSLVEHAAIMEAIADRDPDRAKSAMEAHLDSVIGVVSSKSIGKWL